MRKIGIIGAGGRTGTMFAFELKNLGEVFGISRKEEAKLIREGKIFVRRGKKEELLRMRVIEEEEFPSDIEFDVLFLTISNPIEGALRFYFQKLKEKNFKIPVLFLSQNGIEVSEAAILILKEIFPEKKVPIFRISLFNAINKKIENEKIVIEYSLPIKMAIAKVSGEINESEIFEIFKKNNFEIYLLPKEKRKDMEYSKLFLNLIGMASATHSFSIFEGFLKKEIFREEILAMREYIKVVKKKGGKFLNFPQYPVKFLSLLFYLPFWFLFLFRKFFAKIIEKERQKKPKELREIEYYNGAVVKLGKELGVETPINEKILKRAKPYLLKEQE